MKHQLNESSSTSKTTQNIIHNYHIHITNTKFDHVSLTTVNVSDINYSINDMIGTEAHCTRQKEKKIGELVPICQIDDSQEETGVFQSSYTISNKQYKANVRLTTGMFKLPDDMYSVHVGT